MLPIKVARDATKGPGTFAAFNVIPSAAAQPRSRGIPLGACRGRGCGPIPPAGDSSAPALRASARNDVGRHSPARAFALDDGGRGIRRPAPAPGCGAGNAACAPRRRGLHGKHCVHGGNRRKCRGKHSVYAFRHTRNRCRAIRGMRPCTEPLPACEPASRFSPSTSSRAQRRSRGAEGSPSALAAGGVAAPLHLRGIPRLRRFAPPLGMTWGVVRRPAPARPECGRSRNALA